LDFLLSLSSQYISSLSKSKTDDTSDRNFGFSPRFRRQIKKISGTVKKHISSESLYADVEMRLLNSEREQADGAGLQPTFIAMKGSDEV
jgi:hypothetical protein